MGLGQMAHVNAVCSVFLLSLSVATATRAQNPIRNEDGHRAIEEQHVAVQPRATDQSRTERTAAMASVSGAVRDVNGGAVSGAEVTLTESGGSDVRSTVTGADGTFVFNELPAGSYSTAIKAEGFQAYTSAKFILTAQQAFQIPSIVLSIAAISATVDVRPTEVIAAQQMNAEEKQRVLGVIPDFYTSYVWNAAPLDTKQKFSLAARKTFDPVAFIGISLGAGIEQARNIFPGYGQGVEGYAKRWGALFANGRTSDFLNRAVFPSLFHQDPRYFYQGSGSTWSRVRHAVGDAFVARSDSGHLMPNYSYLLGNISSSALSNLYYPASSRGAGLILTNAVVGLAGRAGQNLVREFIFKHLTKHVPGNGKPATSTENP
jgi:hypothetical protein